LGHSEYGWTRTRADGAFDLVVNGGGPLVLTYAKPPYLPAQRQVDVPWDDAVWAPDVVLVALDANVTAIGVDSMVRQVAGGSSVADADGARQATVFFPPGTGASLRMADGSIVPVSTLHVRATEYTVGTAGPSAMPGALPPESHYTYAVELSVDEALAAGAK